MNHQKNKIEQRIFDFAQLLLPSDKYSDFEKSYLKSKQIRQNLAQQYNVSYEEVEYSFIAKCKICNNYIDYQRGCICNKECDTN